MLGGVGTCMGIQAVSLYRRTRMNENFCEGSSDEKKFSSDSYPATPGILEELSFSPDSGMSYFVRQGDWMVRSELV